MKKFIFILAIAVALLPAALYTLYKNGYVKDLPSLKRATLAKVNKIISLKSRISSYKKPSSEGLVTLYLKNGSAISGQLIDETKEGYTMLWQGGEVVFSLGEVERLVRGGKAVEDKEGLLFEVDIPAEWPYNNDTVIMLTNGIVMDAKVTDVSKESITVGYSLEEGGTIEQELDRAKIEYMLFEPVSDDNSRRQKANLEKLFPKMEFYKVGNFTIVTDSYITWVKEYKSTLRQAYTDVYLTFFELFKDRKPRYQNFVVIFDDYRTFAEYAIADGVPAWAVLGYFRPDDKILYLFNSLGERYTDYLLEIWLGSKTRQIDRWADDMKEQYKGRYEKTIDGMAKDVKDRFWRYHNIIKGELRRQTMSTLRHEFTHELFNNWGLQNIIVSRVTGDRQRLIDKKKDFLETDDAAKKREIFIDLINMRSRQKLPEMEAANSWLAEGVATFSETDPPGSQNDRWLYVFQKMVREDAVYPLEYLTVYKIGSFPGVYRDAMLNAYAQSWAFVTFLMNRYPKEFMEYQRRLSEDSAKGQEDIKWLLEALGKELKPLEKEFVKYMDRYEDLEDPFAARYERMLNIFNEFRM